MIAAKAWGIPGLRVIASSGDIASKPVSPEAPILVKVRVVGLQGTGGGESVKMIGASCHTATLASLIAAAAWKDTQARIWGCCQAQRVSFKQLDDVLPIRQPVSSPARSN